MSFHIGQSLENNRFFCHKECACITKYIQSVTSTVLFLLKMKKICHGIFSEIDTFFLFFLGGSDDWAKGGANIKYSYTIELPDTGRHGFLLPAKRALQTGKEALAMTIAMINAL